MRGLLRAIGAVVLLLVGRRRAPDPGRPHAEPPEAIEFDARPDRRAENAVLALLVAGALGAAGFIVFYVAFPDTQLLGLCIGLGLVCLGAAAALAGKRVVLQEKAVEEYQDFDHGREQADVPAIVAEGDTGVSRRGLLVGTAGAAGATLGAAALLPIASLGPNVGERIHETPWRAGRRLVGADDQPLEAGRVAEGTFLTAFPEGASRTELGAPLVLVRVPARRLELPPERRDGAPLGIVAFSKICPHAGCAISIYRNPLYAPTEPRSALICPCHYSTFDPARGGHLLFGPAGRDLPQLPLRIGAGGVLEAGGDFYDTIGPSYGGTRLRDRDPS